MLIIKKYVKHIFQNRCSRFCHTRKYGSLMIIIFSLYILESFARSTATSLNSISNLDEDVCITPGCQDAANLIRDNINEDVNPCIDFYEFACGGFIEKAVIPKNQKSVGRLSFLQNKVMQDIKTMLEEEPNPNEPKIFSLVKNFYTACVDESTIESLGLQPLWEVIDELGGWPVIAGDAWNEGDFNWMETSIKLRELGYPQEYILKVFVYNDLYNTSQNLLYISEGKPKISAAVLQSKTGTRGVEAYYHYMIEIAVLLGADREIATRELQETIELEIILSKLASSDYDYSNGKVNITTIEDLETQFPYIPWLDYLNSITNPIVHLERSHNVKVEKPFYLDNLHIVLEKVSQRTLANYLIWRTIADSVPYLSRNIRQKYDVFLKEYTGKNTPQPKPRWKECINTLIDKNNGLTVGISSLYIRRYFDNTIRKDVKKIVLSIAKEFQYLLQQVTWMDDETKYNALRKSHFMQRIIGYPDELLNDKTIDDYSYGLYIDPKNYFNNFLNLHRFHYDYSLSGLHNLTNISMWTVFADSIVTNAYYYSLGNTFVLLAAILQPPMFNPNWPSYAKYGSVGFIIAHEMMHAFDSERFVYDENGSFRQWFTEDSANEYFERAACYMDQYEQFEDPHTGLNINGSLTLDENLADNVGLKVSYSAYKKWTKQNKKELRLPGLEYTPEQIFWISSINFLCNKHTEEHQLIVLLTSEHTPDSFRAMGEVSNSKDFAKAFNCPMDSPMNPRKKCNFS